MSESPSAEDKPKRFRLSWLGAGVLLWVSAPIVLVLLLTAVAQQQTVYGDLQPTWIHAEDAGKQASRQVELALTWGEPTTVFAPAWSGTVREVLVSPGGTIKSGDAVAQIDGAVRIAWHSAAPFYRSLTSGDRGDDVAALNQLLRARGLPSSGDDVFTSTTRRGVALLAQGLGAGPHITTFDPSLVLYLPEESLVLTEVHLTVGGLAPGAGEAVLVARPSLARAVLVESGSSGDQGTATPVAAEPDETLLVGNKGAELANRRELAGPELVALGSEVASDQKLVAATLRRDLPKGSVQIPAAAVHTDRVGVTCVVVRHGTSRKTVRVAVVGGLSGQTIVTGALSPSDEVGVGALGATARCNS